MRNEGGVDSTFPEFVDQQLRKQRVGSLYRRRNRTDHAYTHEKGLYN
jgi:hypothetical protein